MIIQHHDFGGSGPLLVLLHANGFHAHVYLPIARGLMGRFRCIALDLPGHGEAAADEGQDLMDRLTSASLAEATHAYLDRMGFKGEGSEARGLSTGHSWFAVL